ncbi:hypothetical protein K461DRAFT_10609 [Myriangium duriaei CBS 260.36]|uniref:Rhodopsin domain-containing protein n=1 Tax=Myriangium duriaei CBS 260.36 TaxID=1168546 RepID=A0A9P4J939_9PEZI|nr:hypothetical protein K461DRAFT_10609 [Myriangium duriaei CBS 260.36]
MVHISQRSVQAVNISLLIVTSLFATSRLLLPIWLKRRYCYKDIWLGAAFFFFVSCAILYIVLMPTVFMIGPTDTELMKHATIIVKAMFAAAMLHWFVLWSVKFSLLALYTQLLKRAATVYNRLWWAIVVFNFLVGLHDTTIPTDSALLTRLQTLLGSVLSLVFACGPHPHDQFVVTRCLKPSSLKGSAMSLWLGYASDISTDLLIVIFPIGLIRNLNMPIRQKLSVIGIFCLGLVCIITATIRVCEVGKTINAQAVPDLPWLALWSLVEASIAIAIGCAAGFHELTQKIGSNKTQSSGSGQGSKVRWYSENSVKMSTLRSNLEPIDDPNNSSQEELTGSIKPRHDFVGTRLTLHGS